MCRPVALERARVLILLAAIAAGGTAHAAKREYLIVNEAAPSFGLDAKALDAIWKEDFPAQIPKLFPPSKYGFLAVIDGGIDQAGKCVVTTRATMLPRAGKLLQFRPVRSAVVFDALTGTTREKCADLAKSKLDQAIEGMLTGIVAEK